MTPVERAAVVSKVSEAIKAELDPMAQLISTEMGSPIGWGMMAQVLAPAMIFDYYVGLASTYPFDEVRPGPARPGARGERARRRRRSDHPVERPAVPGGREARAVADRRLHGGVQACP